MYVNFLSTYSDKKSCHTSITLQTSIARFVSDAGLSAIAAIAELLVPTPVSFNVGMIRGNCHITSSSAVAKRPRDASCLSLVSFNSTNSSRQTDTHRMTANRRFQWAASTMDYSFLAARLFFTFTHVYFTHGK